MENRNIIDGFDQDQLEKAMEVIAIANEFDMNKVKAELKDEAVNHESVEDFIAYIGWEDWMYTFLFEIDMPSWSEYDELTEAQSKAINDFLLEIYKEARK